MTSVRRAPVAPVVTRTVDVFPLDSTVTDPLCSAELGTVTTSRAVFTARVTDALLPSTIAEPAGTRTVTGYVVALLVEVEPLVSVGNRLIAVTVPSTGLLAPSLRTEAVSPAVMLRMLVDGTSTSTSTAPLPRIVMASVVAAVLPALHGMLATVPAIGAVSVTDARSFSATDRATSAALTAAPSLVSFAAELVEALCDGRSLLELALVWLALV